MNAEIKAGGYLIKKFNRKVVVLMELWLALTICMFAGAGKGQNSSVGNQKRDVRFLIYDDAGNVFVFPPDKEIMHITRQCDGGEQKMRRC